MEERGLLVDMPFNNDNRKVHEILGTCRGVVSGLPPLRVPRVSRLHGFCNGSLRYDPCSMVSTLFDGLFYGSIF